MGGFSPIHIILVLVIIVLLFGAGRVSNLMGDVAKGIKSFKQGMAEEDEPSRRIASEQPLDARPIAPPPRPSRRIRSERPCRPPRRRCRPPRRTIPTGAPDPYRRDGASCSASISSELLVIALIALVVIGPKDLPRVMRTVGNWVGRARGMAQPFPRRHGQYDPRIRARRHGEEVEGRERADHARSSPGHSGRRPRGRGKMAGAGGG